MIAKNMMDESGELNPVIPGQRIDAIFGFCDIRQFTDTTECLQEDVMVFVNKVRSPTFQQLLLTMDRLLRLFILPRTSMAEVRTKISVMRFC